MSKKSASLDNLILPLNPSKWLKHWVVSIYVLATLSLVALAIDYFWVSFLLPVLMIHAHFTLRQQIGLQAPGSIVQCQQISQHFWRLTTRAGVSLLVKKQGKAYRTPWLVILPFKYLSTDRCFLLLLAHDSMAKRQYSALLARLWPE